MTEQNTVNNFVVSRVDEIECQIFNIMSDESSSNDSKIEEKILLLLAFCADVKGKSTTNHVTSIFCDMKARDWSLRMRTYLRRNPIQQINLKELKDTSAPVSAHVAAEVQNTEKHILWIYPGHKISAKGLWFDANSMLQLQIFTWLVEMHLKGECVHYTLLPPLTRNCIDFLNLAKYVAIDKQGVVRLKKTALAFGLFLMKESDSSLKLLPIIINCFSVTKGGLINKIASIVSLAFYLLLRSKINTSSNLSLAEG
jgi:hypothetical protein